MALESDALTAQEVAELLQVSRNTVYNLVKKGVLTSYSVGRKMRFSMSDVDHYIEAARNCSASSAPAEVLSSTAPAVSHTATMPTQQMGTPVLRIGGTDMTADIVANYLGTSGIAVQRSYEGGYQALCAMYLQGAEAAVIHLYDRKTNRYNIPSIQRIVPGTPLVAIHLAKRRVGFLVQNGNPHHIRSWRNLLNPAITIANRPVGTEERVLLDEMLVNLEAGENRPRGYQHEFTSVLAAAGFVKAGAADVCIGDERTFHQVEGIDFLPLAEESIDLAIRKTDTTREVIRFLRGMVKSRLFKEELARNIGYGTFRTGEIIYEV